MFLENNVIEVNNATILQQERDEILTNISFQMEKGEFVYLIGRTGSGKTSLLKTLYCDLPLVVGNIRVAGYDLRRIKKKKIPYLRRKTGVIFQDFELFYDRSVLENLLFVLKCTGWTDSMKIKNRIAEVLMRVGLASVPSKMPHQLSGGEQQRLVIARSILNQPSILIADEPTGNLDPDVSEGILKLFMEINNSGTAILMATHNHQLIKKFPRRVLKCENGRILDFLNAKK